MPVLAVVANFFMMISLLNLKQFRFVYCENRRATSFYSSVSWEKDFRQGGVRRVPCSQI